MSTSAPLSYVLPTPILCPCHLCLSLSLLLLLHIRVMFCSFRAARSASLCVPLMPSFPLIKSTASFIHTLFLALHRPLIYSCTLTTPSLPLTGSIDPLTPATFLLTLRRPRLSLAYSSSQGGTLPLVTTLTNLHAATQLCEKHGNRWEVSTAGKEQGTVNGDLRAHATPAHFFLLIFLSFISSILGTGENDPHGSSSRPRLHTTFRYSIEIEIEREHDEGRKWGLRTREKFHFIRRTRDDRTREGKIKKKNTGERNPSSKAMPPALRTATTSRCRGCFTSSSHSTWSSLCSSIDPSTRREVSFPSSVCVPAPALVLTRGQAAEAVSVTR
jgi:hypothetical protein